MSGWATQACHPAGTSLRLTTVHQPPCPPTPHHLLARFLQALPLPDFAGGMATPWGLAEFPCSHFLFSSLQNRRSPQAHTTPACTRGPQEASHPCLAPQEARGTHKDHTHLGLAAQLSCPHTPPLAQPKPLACRRLLQEASHSLAVHFLAFFWCLAQV